MKKLMALLIVLVFSVMVYSASAGTRRGGTHSKRPRIVVCYVEGELIKTTKKACRDQGGELPTAAELVVLKKRMERQAGM